ncbi:MULTISPECIES: hypothetical protein [unclassified Campylobacter]|uniref:hypothetical protein n=1 Tax=unclassified Campylobacter TaxID=2593542 RepID=UPI003D352A7E
MGRADATMYNASILALAQPQKSAITQAGEGLLRANDYLWNEKLRGLQEKGLNLDLQAKQQSYDFNEKKNPLELEKAELSNEQTRLNLSDSYKDSEQKDRLRPLELAQAQNKVRSSTAQAQMDEFKNATKKSVFDMDMASKRADIVSKNITNDINSLKRNELVDEIQAGTNARKYTQSGMQNLEDIAKAEQADINTIMQDDTLSTKQKLRSVDLIRRAAKQARGIYYGEGEQASKINLTDAKAQKALTPQQIKNKERQEAIKNIPVGQQKELQNAFAISQMLIDFAHDAIEAEDQTTGWLDAMTTPAGYNSGLVSDRVSNLHSKAQAIAEKQRASTKNGGQAGYNRAFNNLKPGRVFFNNYATQIASEFNDQLATLQENIKLLERQGNYAGVQEYQEMYDDIVKKIPDEIKRYTIVKDQLVSSEDDRWKDPKNITTQNNTQNKVNKAEFEKFASDFLSDIDEYGVVYDGTD